MFRAPSCSEFYLFRVREGDGSFENVSSGITCGGGRVSGMRVSGRKEQTLQRGLERMGPGIRRPVKCRLAVRSAGRIR